MITLWKYSYLFLAFFLFSCYPTEERYNLDRKDLLEGRHVKAPTKIHLLDGSVILCNQGFLFRDDTIHTSGFHYSFSRGDSMYSWRAIPLDSVAALEYFDKSVRGSREYASFLLGATIAGEIALGSLIIIKAIFGSCPTVYSFRNSQEQLEAECFSYSIGRQFEMADLDRLCIENAREGSYILRLKNEALETHYIDEFALCYVDHPSGTEVFPTDEGNIITTSNSVSLFSAVNSEGKDILETINNRDDIFYRCDSATVARMFANQRKDWIDCTIPAPPRASTVTVAMRAKNTLQNTVLLYDVMMRNQGLDVLEWSKDINESWWYAWKLARWYKEFSGIEVLVYQDGEYIPCARFFDTGPIAWKLSATQFPVNIYGDSIRIRFKFLPDSWDIDWIGFDFNNIQSLPIRLAACIDAKDNTGTMRYDLIESIRSDDKKYFVTYPGEVFDLKFRITSLEERKAFERTFFVRSKGYYVEWVRAEWIRERPDNPGFDISKRDEIEKRLAKLWLAKKSGFEQQFFRDRLPSWDPGGRK